MTTKELIERIATNHNRIADMTVSGDNAIAVGDTLKDMRDLFRRVQQEGVQQEAPSVDADEK